MPKFFVRSILYNQIPLTYFFTLRVVLASFALFVMQVMVSFIFPFYSLLMNKLTVSISFYICCAILAYLITAAQGIRIVNCFRSARAVIFISLLMGAASTFLLSWSPDQATLKDQMKTFKPSEASNKILFLTPQRALFAYIILTMSAGLTTAAAFAEI